MPYPISLDNILSETIPLEESSSYIFKDDDGNLPPEEHLDQIFPLNKKASSFLWNLETWTGITTYYNNLGRYFKDTERFSFGSNMEKQVKKWLYNRGIKFDQIVFIPMQPDRAIALTWKMVIHYSPDLFFGHDLAVWDRTLNWVLIYDHNDIFNFGKNRIYDGQKEMLKMNETIKEMIESQTRRQP